MAKKKNVLTDLQIKEAEEGRQPGSKMETYEKEREAVFGQAEKTQARMVDATEEEIKTIARGERYFKEHMKKKNKK